MITLLIDGQPATVRVGDFMYYDVTRRQLTFRRRLAPEAGAAEWCGDQMDLADGSHGIEVRAAPIQLAQLDDFARIIARIADLDVKLLPRIEDHERYEFTELKK